MKTPAVVLSGHTMALGVVRALGMMGVPVSVLHYDPRDMAHCSHFVSEEHLVPHPETAEAAFIETLVTYARQHDRAILIPASDESLTAVSRCKALLSEHYITAFPEWEKVKLFIDKNHTYALAEQAGVPVPKTVVPHSLEEAEQYGRAAQYPCLVKPCRGHSFWYHFRQKMFCVENLDALLDIYRRASALGLEVMLQEVIPGSDREGANYNSYFWDGEPRVEFTAAKLRSAPPKFGSPRVVQSRLIEEIIEPGRRTIQALGFYGYSCTEFKRDPRDGVYKLMEVNGRHNLSSLLAVRCGLNFPWIEYQHLVEGIMPTQQPFTSGIYWIDLTRDLGYSLMHVREERLAPGEYLRPYASPHVFAILDRTDIKPFIARCTYLGKSGLRAGLAHVPRLPQRQPQVSLPLHDAAVTLKEKNNMVKTVWTSCNVCGADHFVPLSKVGDWQIGRCAQCSMIYVNPIPFFPPAPEFSEISSDFDYTRYMYSVTPAIIEFERGQFARQVAFADQFRGHNHSTRRFLDVGCGSGAGVRAACDLGWQATGIDLDPKLIGIGQRELNVDLRCAPLLDSPLENGCYDFIRLRDVIEHLPNPYEVLRRIYDLLAPGGVLLIVTPNEDGLPTQLRLRAGKPRDRVATVAPPHHLHGFTPNTLRRIFERAGFLRHEISTTTPIDTLYVTSNNMRSAGDRAKVLFWQTAKALGTGSVLYGWTIKPEH